MIEVNQLTKKYGDLTVLENFNMKVNKSSIYGLVGHNGAGKTTLLKTLIGMYKPDSGEVLINGSNVYDNPAIKSNMFFCTRRIIPKSPSEY